MAQLPESLLSPRISIVVGHTGSGKTEFSVNLALALSEAGKKTVLADLDVVNPYYRSRERRVLLKEHGVGLIASSQACLDADLPAMPAELHTLFDDATLTGVMDIGGSAAGARVLARYRPRILVQSHTVLFVLNSCRPATGSVQGALESMEEISSIMGLPISGIVNNTHLCSQTTPETLLWGIELAREVARKSQLPLICHTVPEELQGQLAGIPEPLFTIRRYMKNEWEI